MVGALSRGQGVGMFFIMAKIVSPVLQAETPASRYDTCSKAHIVAVDE